MARVIKRTEHTSLTANAFASLGGPGVGKKWELLSVSVDCSSSTVTAVAMQMRSPSSVQRYIFDAPAAQMNSGIVTVPFHGMCFRYGDELHVAFTGSGSAGHCFATYVEVDT